MNDDPLFEAKTSTVSSLLLSCRRRTSAHISFHILFSSQYSQLIYLVIKQQLHCVSKTYPMFLAII